MKVKQISVSIENSHDRLYEFTKALADHGINLRALNLVDTGYLGELRILVSDVATARQILMQKEIPGRVDDVVAVEIEDQPGQFSRLLKDLMDANIKIKYSYACAGMNSGTAVMIFCFSDNDQAIEVLRGKNVRLLDFEAFDGFEAASRKAG
ncbi:MAG: amino acid-binding protein [Desulfobacterales bacterium]|nr:MAG: amino acid-binding protein [Desulfobacterales bacterium]